MRIIPFAALLAITLCTSAFSCNEKDIAVHNLRGYFWTTDAPGITHRLYIDKQYKGNLPHLSNPIHDSTAINQGLNVPLSTGTHEVIITDNNETVISKGEIQLKFTDQNTKIGTSWNNGRCGVKVVHGE